MYTQEDLYDIDRFEGEGGRVVWTHMSDGHDVLKQDVSDYIKHHPGVHTVGVGSTTQQCGEPIITRKLNQSVTFKKVGNW